MKSIVITGCTSGLGLALAYEFLSNGWRVFGCGNSETKISELAKIAPKEFYVSVVDVCDYDALDEWAMSIVTEFGSPDIVLANAGFINERRPIWESDIKDVRKTIEVNVLGVFNTDKAFLPHLLQSNDSILINMSSGWGRYPADGLSPYCASKFAVEGLSKSIALETNKVKVIPLDPGNGINTEMLASCLPREHHEYPTPKIWASRALPYILNVIPTLTTGDSAMVPYDEEIA